MNIETERFEPIKRGDHVQMRLIATNTPLDQRMANGITDNVFTGKATVDLIEGQTFSVDVGFDLITTSVVTRVGVGMFTTKNSSYAIAKHPTLKTKGGGE